MINKIKYFEKFGYGYFGPLLYVFSKWLLLQLENNNIEKVYFLSRDGYIMKEAFDIINSTNIKSYYFYASRRATIVPYLWKLKNEDEIFEVIAFNKRVTIKSFLKKVGLEDFDVDIYLKKYNYTKEDYISVNNRTINFNNFLKEIFVIIKNNSKKEWNCLIKYAKKNNFEGKVAIVDIGWYGSMQNSLEKLFDNVDIFGYYFGLVPNKKMNIKKSFGYLFDRNKNINNFNKLHYFINIFEFLFLAQHGSVKKYNNSDDSVDLYDYEYYELKEKKYVEHIQEFSLKFIKDNKNKIPNESVITNNFINYFINPNIQTAQIFGNLKFNDDEFKYIAKPSSLFNYIFNLKKFKKDFINSSWRIGFLKRLFIVPLPYYAINEKIRKIYFNKRGKSENV